MSGHGSRGWLRGAALLAWAALLALFWIGARRAGADPLAYASGLLDAAASRVWTPVALLLLYALRPLLLVPVTVLNLASGFLLGPAAGAAWGMAGVLLSASTGYGIGRFFGSAERAEALLRRWPFVRALRRRSFEAVVAGGLMYLHADAVNLPAGLLGIRFPVFLAGIAVGNALWLVAAVLAGASVEGRLADASLRLDPSYLAAAAALLVASVALAALLRRRLRAAE